jgi:hypothetical protein
VSVKEILSCTKKISLNRVVVYLNATNAAECSMKLPNIMAVNHAVQVIVMIVR